MNKSGLIEALSAKENLTEKKAIDVVNLVFKGFTDELKKGGRIEIRGFGSFSEKLHGLYRQESENGEEYNGIPEETALLQGG